MIHGVGVLGEDHHIGPGGKGRQQVLFQSGVFGVGSQPPQFGEEVLHISDFLGGDRSQVTAVPELFEGIGGQIFVLPIFLGEAQIVYFCLQECQTAGQTLFQGMERAG